MSVESARATVMRYLGEGHGGADALADDVVFTTMATGEETHGRPAVLAMVDHIYHVAFDATAVPGVMLFGEDNAMFEGEFVGRHIAEYAGVPATGKDVRVPMCIVYDVENEQIKRGRIYFELPALLAQLGVPMG